MAAEERLEDALRKRDELRNPKRWSAYETVSLEGRKSIQLTALHFDRIDRADADVLAAERHLRGLWAQLLAEAAPDGLRGA